MDEAKQLPDDVASLASTIQTIVNEEFEQTRRVVLLSTLGQSLRRAGIDFPAILQKRKLAEFIREDMKDQISVVSVPGKDKVLAAYPATFDLGQEIDPFGRQVAGSRTGTGVEEVREKRPLIHSQVWFAFSHFLADGQVRLLELEPEPLYRDVPEDAVWEKSGRKVDRELIVPVGTLAKAERDSKIFANLRKWAADQGLRVDDLLERKIEREGRRSLLDEVLATIGTGDLARISIPLDLVKALRDRRI